MEEKSGIRIEDLQNLQLPNMTPIAKAPTIQKNIEGIGTGKVESLKEAIKEIHNMILERKKLSKEYIQQGETMKREINNFLKENAITGEDDTEFARERAELRKKQIEISEAQLNEKINCWKDIVRLKEEEREREKELQEKEQRAEMIGKILEE